MRHWEFLGDTQGADLSKSYVDVELNEVKLLIGRRTLLPVSEAQRLLLVGQVAF